MIYLNEVMFKKSRGSPSEGIVWLPQKEEMNAGELRVPPQRPLRLRATSASESIRETRPPPPPLLDHSLILHSSLDERLEDFLCQRRDRVQKETRPAAAGSAL